MVLRRFGFFMSGLAFACISLGSGVGSVAAASPPMPNLRVRS